MPPAQKSLNVHITTMETITGDGQEKTVVTSSVIKILLFVLGAILLCSVVLILLATALTHTTWFLRRRRSFHRRLDSSSSRPKFGVKDHILNYMYVVVEALAINFGNDDETSSKTTKTSIQKSFEKTCEPPSLPLRFQPEKLYGTTTSLHRDKYRKASCINLPLHSHQNQYRKKSMLDGFIFSEQRRGSRLSDTNTLSRSNLSIQHSHLAGSDKSHYETMKFPSIEKVEQQDIPVILSDLPRPSNYDHICSRQTSVSTEDSKYFCPPSDENCLSVPLMARRASATDYELLDSRSAKTRKVSYAPISITITDTQSDTDDTVNVKTDETGFLSTSVMALDDPRVIRRNSFLSYATVLGKTGTEDLVTGEDYKSIYYTARQTPPMGSSASLSNVVHADESLLQNTNIDQINSLAKRLPPVITYDWMQYPAGIMAVGVKYLSEISKNESRVFVTLHTAKNLLSPRLWHKTTFSVQCIISTKDHSQMFTIHSKETEFGCPQFLNNNEVSMNIPVRKSSMAPAVNDTEIPKIHIQMKIFESIPKWSGDKEYYHGSCSMSTQELPVSQGDFEHVGWCLVEEAYPVIRLSGDMLISLCRNQNKGFVNIRIHEMRNLKFTSYGRWRIENLNALLNNRSYEITLHACLVHAGRIMKAVKATTVHYPVHRSSKTYQTDGHSLLESKIIEQKTGEKKNSNCFTLSDCSVQFNLPFVKKSFAKHLTVKHGIIIYVTSKLPISDLIPYECANQLKQMGITNMRALNAIGECHFGDYGFQSDSVKDFNRPASCHSSQGYAFWSDAGSRNGTRIYQWLGVE
ncbi:unnamed protein product [Trichobilharzia szidati]|nr:unnamed protein product [Trichobilharzia szidati]